MTEEHLDSQGAALESRAMNSSAKLGIAAVVVSAVVGVLAMVGSIVSAKINTDAAHRDQQERISEDRLRADTAELRGVVDQAAVNLVLGVNLASDVIYYWRASYEPGRSKADRAFRRQHDLDIASAERLNVRLGSSAPMATHYAAAVHAGTQIETETQRHLTPAADRRVAMDQKTLLTERNAFLTEAVQVVGSRLTGAANSH